jgi:hypothetical protein
MAIVINGSGTVTGLAVGGLPDGTVDSGTLATDSVTAAKLEVSAITGADLPAGSVLQVVSVTKSDTSTMNGSTAWTDVPNLSVAITPSSTSSKILIVASITLASGNHAHPRMLRGSTTIGNGASAGSRPGVFGYANNPGGVNSATSNTYNYLDSPNTTSATTYKIQLNNSNGSGACYINRTQDDADGVYSGRGVSSITLLEIGA